MRRSRKEEGHKDDLKMALVEMEKGKAFVVLQKHARILILML